ncbi:MAG: hypothetical protein ISS16_02905 [Ignavibacteria bacterium]|nr:hypothetical protein [Ignavibacteria bacterium]
MSINNPKRIYFDQNKLIDLAKAFNKRADGEKFQDTLELVCKNIDEGKVIVPLSLLHVVETAKVTDAGKKERLSKFIYMLTKNFTILPFFNIRENEIYNSILENENNSNDKIDINRNIIEQKGILSFFKSQLTLPEKFKDLEKEIIGKQLDEKSFITFIKVAIPENISKEMTAEDESMVSLFEAERLKIKSLSKEEAYKHVVSDILSGPLLPGLMTQLESLKIDSKVFTDKFLNNKDTIIGFLNSIPSIEVFAKILLARDRGSKIHRNDIYDMEFLSTAVPYCDIVITERSWCHNLKQEKLDEKYNTAVLNDVNDLKNYF